MEEQIDALDSRKVSSLVVEANGPHSSSIYLSPNYPLLRALCVIGEVIGFLLFFGGAPAAILFLIAVYAGHLAVHLCEANDREDALMALRQREIPPNTVDRQLELDRWHRATYQG